MEKLNLLTTMINDPTQLKNNSIEAVKILEELCQKKVNPEFMFDGHTYCCICLDFLNEQPQNLLPCGHNAHIKCFQKMMLELSEFLIVNDLRYCCSKTIDCGSKEINQVLLYQFFGKVEVDRLQEIPNQRLIEELEKQDKLIIEQRENQMEFDCGICITNLKVNQDAITLDCDHRFCRECITSTISENVNSGKFRDDQIVCPQCNKSVDIYIIKALCPKEHDKIIEFRIKNLGIGEDNKDKNEILINCPYPGCPMKFYVTKNLPFPHCPECKNQICINGCDKAHEGVTCEVYRKKIKANESQGLTQCPKCKAPIQKDGGCNHITCICKHEFCYVCKKDYKPKKLCDCPQMGRVERVFNQFRNFFHF